MRIKVNLHWKSLLLLLTTALFAFSLQKEEFPSYTIKNGLLEAKIYAPDNEIGYYRGVRFDKSGVISSLRYKGHEYFGKWYERHDPTHHDAITGPVDEFMPLGFEEAGIGEDFVKVGVGVLTRTDLDKYSFVKKYPIKDAGVWKTEVESNQITFTHTLEGANGYAYEYVKKVKLVKGKSTMLLEHSLKNTGKKVLKTSTYNHHFFVLDNAKTGPSIETTFSDGVKGTGKSFDDLVYLEGNKLTYKRALEKGESVFTNDLRAENGDQLAYAMTIFNKETNAGVRIKGDQPVEKMVFWACATTSCPEPYIALTIPSGKKVMWTMTYDFFTSP